MDWNVNKGHRLSEIAAAIRTYEPDIVMLQEVDQGARRTRAVDVTRELAERTGMRHIFSPAFEELGQRPKGGPPAMHGQSLLSRLPIVSTRVLTFRTQSTYWKRYRYLPNSWAIMRRRDGGRIAQISEIDARGTRVVIYNLHLESRGFGRTRTLQFREALEDTRRYPANVPVVIGGDLNTVYSTSPVREALREHGFRNCFERKVRTHRLWGTLDWLAVRGPVTCENATVIRGAKGSDHDPLTATLKLTAP